MAKKEDKKKKILNIDRNAFYLSVIFIIFCLPLVLSVTRIGQEGSRQFSIYNEFWDGTSNMRTQLESEGFEFRPIVSTLNALTRLDTMGVLALIGPAVFFDPTETTALAYFIMRGGSVIIADDFGRANDIFGMINTILAPFISQINGSEAGFSTLPLAGIKINKSLLMDAQSYYKSPVMPVIRNFYNFPGGPSMSGLSRVITSYPSSISFLGFDNDTGETQWVPSFSYMGVPIPSGIMTSSSNSWLETDIESAKQGEYYPDTNEWRGVQFTVMVPLPLSGIGVGNILICSDPSIFINELWDMGYDNPQLASNVFNWLDWNNSDIIYYDESHLASSVLGIIDPFSYISLYLRYVNSMTMFPLLAPFFPLMMLIFLRRRYPKKSGPSPLLMTKIRQQKSRSFFAAKMSWYLNYQQFANALSLLNKRLHRRIKKKFLLEEDLNSDRIVEILRDKFPTEFNFEGVDVTLKRIEEIIQKTKRLSEEEFTQLVIEIKNIEGIVTKTSMG